MKRINKMEQNPKVLVKNKEDTKKILKKEKITITFDALFDKVKGMDYENWIKQNKEMV